jgi:hypothetical protein
MAKKNGKTVTPSPDRSRETRTPRGDYTEPGPVDLEGVSTYTMHPVLRRYLALKFVSNDCPETTKNFDLRFSGAKLAVRGAHCSLTSFRTMCGWERDP